MEIYVRVENDKDNIIMKENIWNMIVYCHHPSGVPLGIIIF